MSLKAKKIWSCQECGHTQLKWNGCCVTCGAWNSLVEEMVAEKTPHTETVSQQTKPMRISEVSSSRAFRLKSQFTELDRVLGGGVVKGSLTLIAGSPGIGKSTLMLQLAQAFASENHKVLYVCGEESCEQTSLRARRIGVNHDFIYLFHHTVFSSISHQIEALQPEIVILDSIQVLYKEGLPSSPGSIVQVREITMECMKLAKTKEVAIFLVGHVTKSGEIAGPKVLEHMVDTVLEFEGDLHFGLRLLRCLKNRFGSTEDSAIFQMKKEGFQEIKNISSLFLEDHRERKSGSVICSAIEGERPFLIEVQALVTPSSYPTPSRRGAGIDQNRLALLLAVIEKRMGYRLHLCDVFVSVAGGMKIVEPAIDLGILLAIASSFTNQKVDSKTLVLGEVGLCGEVRRIRRIESRLKEAVQMGLERVILPQKNKREIGSALAKQIQLTAIDWVEEATCVL